ncbi:hypothetical protein GCM10027200_17660 [Lentzea nigeriaca]
MTEQQWLCPGCGQIVHSKMGKAGDPCIGCETELFFTAQSPETRAEIDNAVASLPNIWAIKRIRELTGCDLSMAIFVHSDRQRAGQDATSG